MKELKRKHRLIFGIYIAVLVSVMALTVVCARLFGILLPFEVIGTIIVLSLLIGSVLRLRLWRRRNRLLTSEELHGRTARIFLTLPLLKSAFRFSAR